MEAIENGEVFFIRKVLSSKTVKEMVRQSPLRKHRSASELNNYLFVKSGVIPLCVGKQCLGPIYRKNMW